MPRPLFACWIVLLCLAIAGVDASAQMSRGGRGRSGEGGMPGGGPRSFSANHNPLLDDTLMQLQDVQQKLKLSGPQLALWDGYAERVTALVQDQVRPPADTPATGDALRQIDRKVDVVRDRLTALEDVADAAKALYQSLTAEQKSLADRLLPATVPALYSGLWQSPQSGQGRIPGVPKEPRGARPDAPGNAPTGGMGSAGG